MNTKLIQQSKPKKLPAFPELNGKNRTKVITKHFSNLALWCSADELRILTWLIYQSKVDNTVKYDTFLLTRYSESIKAAKNLYLSNKVNYNIKHLRVVFKSLIEDGLLLSNRDKKVYTINPNLAYRTEYMKPKDYKYICGLYDTIDAGGISVEDFTFEYTRIVNSYLSKK